MNDTPVPVDSPVEGIVLAVLSVAILLSVWRLLRGPSLPDRVVALDLLGVLTLAFIVTYAVATDSAALIDIALVLALVAFLATVAFAYYLEKSTLPRAEED